MSKNIKKLLCVLLISAMAFALAACGQNSEVTNDTPVTESPTQQDTLVVGYSYFSQKFSPFFSKTGYDADAERITQVSLLGADREGNPILSGIEGETSPFNATDYTYTGISDIRIVQNDDGTVDYNITLRDDVVFSDGVPLTIDDVIFSMYVLSDPTYDGSATFYSLPIEGMAAYRSSMAVLGTLILQAGADNTDFSLWTPEQQTQYWNAFQTAGEDFCREIVDCCIKDYALPPIEGSDVACGMVNWGYGTVDEDGVLGGLPSGAVFDLRGGEVPSLADFWTEIVAVHGYDFSEEGINYESAGSGITELINAQLGADASVFDASIRVGEAVPAITGIRKTGAYSMTVHTTRFETASIYQFAFAVAPMHYYGDESLYDYDQNMFGFNKGDLSIVRDKTTKPLGAGPYKFVSYENGVITYAANENYYKGCPEIEYVLFQECADGDKLSGIVSGSIDITDPGFTTDVIASIKNYNANGGLTGDKIVTSTVDQLGYGYIGICAENVKVGDDPAGAASKNLRRAFATLFAVYRDTVVNSYYGDRANVVEYPISDTSWAAPRPSDDGYAIAYSTDVDGRALYTDGMTEQARYDAALQAAVGFLKAAGYTWDETAGAFTGAPAGARMTYEIAVPGYGTGEHPAYGIATAAKEALASVGITLEINDPADTNTLWNALVAVPCSVEMWAAAWEAVADPDMYQIYHSANINGAGGTESNHFYITDDTLDERIVAARASADKSYRKATYKQCLEIIMDWAVEIPVYQRQSAFIFSAERINMDTMTPDITTFWDWMNDIELLEVH